MKQIDFEANNYEYKEDLKTFVNSLNDLIDKYDKSFSNASLPLNKIETDIEKQEKVIADLDDKNRELSLREEELKRLKENYNIIIKDLTAKKKALSYSDGEVQKLELEDINSEIASKRNQVAKAEAKLATTKEKIKSNSEATKAADKGLMDLLDKKRSCEESVYRTENLLSLIRATKESFNDGVKSILESNYNAPKIEPKEIKEEPEIEKTSEIKIEESVPEVEELASENNINIEPAEEELANITESEPVIEEQIVEEPVEEVVKIDIGALKSIFKKDRIDVTEFTQEAQEEMTRNIDRVTKNLEILKKHSIPVDLTLRQSEIYYKIDPQDLEDLLNIITVDGDGNGMGFTIDFAYNVLNELANTNVDKLIDVYNDEFMNMNSKTGLISLLKLTDHSLGDFENNKKANIDTLKKLGITSTDEIEEKCKEFINLDNPLFINMINLFDKKDLIEKLNNDVSIIPKLVEYWKNN